MPKTHRPNILLIVSDDHAAPAISCYGSEMNRTPNIDRIGNGGMRFNNCFCTNAICTPARGSILTGKYSAHFDIPAHYGVRTERYKLIYYYGEALGSGGAIDRSTPPEWELFDLEKDPYEMHNIYADPAYADVVVELKGELERLRDELGDHA